MLLDLPTELLDAVLAAVLTRSTPSAEHPRGVWTLPPSYALGDEDREAWTAIGESDRYLLKFRRPAK